MKWMIKHIKNGNFFRVINEGIYLISDSVDLYEEIFSNKLWVPGSSILFDNRLVDFGNVNYQVMSEASKRFAAYEKQIGKSKIGYLVESQIGFGISRQFQMLIEGKTSTIIEIFMDEGKALSWIIERQPQ